MPIWDKWPPGTPANIGLDVLCIAWHIVERDAYPREVRLRAHRVLETVADASTLDLGALGDCLVAVQKRRHEEKRVPWRAVRAVERLSSFFLSHTPREYGFRPTDPYSVGTKPAI